MLLAGTNKHCIGMHVLKKYRLSHHHHHHHHHHQISSSIKWQQAAFPFIPTILESERGGEGRGACSIFWYWG